MSGGRLKKTSQQKSQNFKKTQTSNVLLKFSFRFYQTDDEISPQTFLDGYTYSLMKRLRVLSEWAVEDFTGRKIDNIRNHAIKWEETSRAGFGHVNTEHRSAPCWQFAVDNIQYGRVHGLIVGDTFYVVWLDHHHKLYPMPSQNEQNAC